MPAASLECVSRPTLAELFTFNDWAWARLLDAARLLPDAALDRPFEMGPGSLRATLHHLWAAENVWLARWMGRAPEYRWEPNGIAIADLSAKSAATAAERNELLARQTRDSLAASVAFTDSRGTPYSFPLGRLMLHVCNHGSHHRAQALNMLRRLGAALPKPGLDYIFMRLERVADPPPPLDVESVRLYYEYSDWARARVHGAAAELTDEQLDRPFEMGLGTLRATLMHIRFAEQWWLENWTLGPGRPFPELGERTSIRELSDRFDQTRDARRAYLGGLADADLARPVSAVPRPGVTRTFPLGVTMLQTCHHGTHHRAQALNMLRHLGVEPPRLDYVIMLRGE